MILRLVILCLVLGATLMWRLDQKPQATEPLTVAQTSPDAISAATDVEAASPPPRERFSAMVDRPLFIATRRPPGTELVDEPEPVEGPAAEAPLDVRDWRLIGIAVIDDRRHAMLIGPKGQRPSRVTEGDIVEGWRIAEIGARHVTIRQEGVTRRLVTRQ